MRITKEQIPEWEELIRILSLYSIYRVSLHKMKGMSKTLSFFKKKTPPTKVDSIYSRMIIYIYNNEHVCGQSAGPRDNGEAIKVE